MLVQVPKEIAKLPIFELRSIDGYRNNNAYRLIVRKDSKEIVALVSSEYMLIQPREIFSKIYYLALKTSKISSISVSYNNRRQYMEILFKELLNTIDGTYKWGVRAVNSTDGSRIFEIHYILWRLECQNDLFILKSLGVIHKVEIFYRLKLKEIPILSKEFIEKLIRINQEETLGKKEAIRLISRFPRYYRIKGFSLHRYS